MNVLDKYKTLIERNFVDYSHSNCQSRYVTLKYALNHFTESGHRSIVELGTSRSFVDGMFEGCNSDDVKYWNENDPTKWDWSAGCFTRLIPECLSAIVSESFNYHLTTVDSCENHLKRCKIMTNDFNTNITYVKATSEDFLMAYDGKIDFLYIDTGDVTPIEQTAQVQLREAQIIVERDLISSNGLILIDDVRNKTGFEQDNSALYGKAKYSIPYFLSNGFEICMNEYQVVLKKLKCVSDKLRIP
jgi:hypothetical protein